jgi:hypothetical protein
MNRPLANQRVTLFSGDDSCRIGHLCGPDGWCRITSVKYARGLSNGYGGGLPEACQRAIRLRGR